MVPTFDLAPADSSRTAWPMHSFTYNQFVTQQTTTGGMLSLSVSPPPYSTVCLHALVQSRCISILTSSHFAFVVTVFVILLNLYVYQSPPTQLGIKGLLGYSPIHPINFFFLFLSFIYFELMFTRSKLCVVLMG